MEQQSPVQTPNTTDTNPNSKAGRLAPWQQVRRPRRGRLVSQPEVRGPYETSYTIAAGYPGREDMTP